MRLAVFGATGATGRCVVELALAAGHSVHTLVRGPSQFNSPEVSETRGSVLDPKAVQQTIDGADAVLCCLGTPLVATFAEQRRIVAPGTAHIIAGMRACAVRRLVSLSTYGAGESWHALTPAARWMMSAVLWGELADKNAMEASIRGSGLDWTIVRPVNLTNGTPSGSWTIVDASEPVGLRDQISRRDLATGLLAILADPSSIGQAFVVRSRSP